jgi:ADP-ribose pyrophosphatase
MKKVLKIEKLEDRTAESRSDEGFIRVKRYVLKNQYSDDSESREYNCDIVRRRDVDAVAVILFYRDAESGRIMVGLRQCIRPPVYFRSERQLQIPDEKEYTTLLEVVAGAIEEQDTGWEGMKRRAAIEVKEEAGFDVQPESIIPLGRGGMFSSPGVSDEKVYLTAAEVDPDRQGEIGGDGSPMEEAGAILFFTLEEALRKSWDGELEDAKTDVCLYRLARHLNVMLV